MLMFENGCQSAPMGSPRSRHVAYRRDMSQVSPMCVAGEPVHGDETFDLRSPYDGAQVGTTSWATADQVEAAVRAAHDVRHEAAALSISVRAEALAATSAAIAERAEELAGLITAENGKPIMWARAEVGRAVSVFRIAAEETRR